LRQGHEVLALPVVPKARLNERIERRLPLEEQSRRDEIANGVAERLAWCDGVHPIGDGTAMTKDNNGNTFFVPGRRDERNRRRSAKVDRAREVI
jgi:hypothetical protein